MKRPIFKTHIDVYMVHLQDVALKSSTEQCPRFPSFYRTCVRPSARSSTCDMFTWDARSVVHSVRPKVCSQHEYMARSDVVI